MLVGILSEQVSVSSIKYYWFSRYSVVVSKPVCIEGRCIPGGFPFLVPVKKPRKGTEWAVKSFSFPVKNLSVAISLYILLIKFIY